MKEVERLRKLLNADFSGCDCVVRMRYTPTYRDGRMTVRARPEEPQAGRRKKRKARRRKK